MTPFAATAATRTIAGSRPGARRGSWCDSAGGRMGLGVLSAIGAGAVEIAEPRGRSSRRGARDVLSRRRPVLSSDRPCDGPWPRHRQHGRSRAWRPPPRRRTRRGALRGLQPMLSRISMVGLGDPGDLGPSPHHRARLLPVLDFWFWLKALAVAGMIAMAYLMFQAIQHRAGQAGRPAADADVRAGDGPALTLLTRPVRGLRLPLKRRAALALRRARRLTYGRGRIVRAAHRTRQSHPFGTMTDRCRSYSEHRRRGLRPAARALRARIRFGPFSSLDAPERRLPSCGRALRGSAAKAPNKGARSI